MRLLRLPAAGIIVLCTLFSASCLSLTPSFENEDVQVSHDKSLICRCPISPGASVESGWVGVAPGHRQDGRLSPRNLAVPSSPAQSCARSGCPPQQRRGFELSESGHRPNAARGGWLWGGRVPTPPRCPPAVPCASTGEVYVARNSWPNIPVTPVCSGCSAVRTLIKVCLKVLVMVFRTLARNV